MEARTILAHFELGSGLFLSQRPHLQLRHPLPADDDVIVISAVFFLNRRQPLKVRFKNFIQEIKIELLVNRNK